MIAAVLVHGWTGIGLAYAAVQVPMVAGLVRARAQIHHYLLCPVVAASLTATASIGLAISSTWFAKFGFAGHELLQWTLGFACSTALGYGGGKMIAQKNSRYDGSHHRGAIVTADSSVEVCGSRKNESNSAAITLAGLAVPAGDETKHFKLIGTTGTGKSTAIQEILATALARGDRAVIADPDGGYLQRFYQAQRGDVILNPFEQRSVKWDLFTEIKNSHDVDQLARSLIPDHDGQDRSWRSYARTFLTAVTRQAHQAGIKDTIELYRLLVIADAGELRALVRGTPAQPFLEEHNSRMFDSIRSVTSSAVAALEYIGHQEAPGFSVREWVRSEASGVLFIPYKAGQIAALHSTISAWMRLAIFEAMDRNAGSTENASSAQRPLWFVVDELDALGQIDGLKDALARLRKFGGRCVLGFQSIAQVSSTYGHGDAHTIVENCGNTLILRCSASEGGGTARFASQLIGEREVVQIGVSKTRRFTELFGSTTHSEQLRMEPAVLASQVEQLPDLTGYLKYASEPQWQKIRLDAKRAWHRHRCQSTVEEIREPSSLGRMSPSRSMEEVEHG